MDPKVFVSFSGQDTRAAARLLQSLKRYGLDVWDYSRVGTRVPYGSDVNDYCRERIRESVCFLALISPNTVSAKWGRYPQLETLYALELQATDRSHLAIVPVYDRATPVADPPDPYSSLTNRLRMTIDSTSDDSVDEAVRRLCVETLGLDPVPTAVIDPRVRMIEHFRSEFREFERMSGSRLVVERADYIQMHRLAEEFSEELSREPPDYGEALTIVQELQRVLKRKGLAKALYFLLPMQGLCLYERGEIGPAKAMFEAAAAHPGADIHAFAGLALVEARLGNSAVALNYLVMAESFPNAQPGWELKFNVACLLLGTGAAVEVDQAVLQVDPDLLLPEDWAKWKTLEAAILLQKGKVLPALNILEIVIARRVNNRSVADDNSITWYAQALVAAHRQQEAIHILEEEADKRNNPELRYRAALFCEDAASWLEALAVFERLCGDQNVRDLRYLVGYMRLLKGLGRRPACEDVCRRVLVVATGLPHVSPEDHFHIGHCHFVLGDLEIAKYEWSMGAMFSTVPYNLL